MVTVSVTLAAATAAAAAAAVCGFLLSVLPVSCHHVAMFSYYGM